MREFEMAITILMFPTIFGIICACIAKGKMRSGIGWFFGGFFLGIIGLIIIICLGPYVPPLPLLPPEQLTAADELLKLKRMRENGLISEEEYEALKEKLLR